MSNTKLRDLENAPGANYEIVSNVDGEWSAQEKTSATSTKTVIVDNSTGSLNGSFSNPTAPLITELIAVATAANINDWVLYKSPIGVVFWYVKYTATTLDLIHTENTCFDLRAVITLPPEFEDRTTPFGMGRNADGTYYYTPFDLQLHADVASQATYYVDPAAAGTGTGEDFTNAFTSIQAAITAANNGGVGATIHLAKAYYYENISWTATPTVDIQFIGDLTQGTGDAVYITKDFSNTLSGWTTTSNYQSINTGSIGVTSVLDKANTDTIGDDLLYKKVTSIAEVDTEAGTWFWDSVTSILYIRTSDARSIDADIAIASWNIGSVVSGDITVYGKDIKFKSNNLTVRAASATEVPKAYFEDIELDNCIATVHGVNEFIIKNSTIHNAASDLINYDERFGVPCFSIELDSSFYNNIAGGNVDTTSQGSTAHQNSYIVRINNSVGVTTPQVANIAGSNGIADVNGVVCINLGNTIKGTTGNGYFIGTGAASTMYIFGGEFDTPSNDIEVGSGAKLYYYDLPYDVAISDLGGDTIQRDYCYPVNPRINASAIIGLADRLNIELPEQAEDFSPWVDITHQKTNSLTDAIYHLGRIGIGAGANNPAELIEVVEEQDDFTAIQTKNISGDSAAKSGFIAKVGANYRGEIYQSGLNHSSSGATAPNTFHINGFGTGGVRIIAGDAAGEIRFYSGGAGGSNRRLTIDAAGKTTVRNVMNLTPISTVPSSPSTGDMYMDDGTNTAAVPTLRYYNGSMWVNVL